MKMPETQAILYACWVFSSLIWAVISVPQPMDMSAEVRQGSGKFIVLLCSVPADCSDINFLITLLPTKGQIFRVKGSPNQNVSTFERSDLIQAAGVQLSNRIIYYLPFHEVSNTAVEANTIVSDAFGYKAHAGSSEARCLIEILRQAMLPIGGGSGYSLLFDGVDDIVVTPVDSWFPKDAFTVMLWIREYDRLKQATVFSFFGADGPVFELSNPSNLTCIVGFQTLSPSNIDVSDGKWHHVAVTWSSSSMACQIFVDAKVPAVATASNIKTPNMQSTATIVLGNRQACDILNNVEQMSLYSQSKTLRTATAIPTAENVAYNFSTTPSALLAQHVIHRAHGSSAPTDISFNSRQRSDYLLCRCAGGCFHPSFAFGGEMDDFRLYSFEKTIPEILIESKFVFEQKISNSLPLNKTRPQMEQQYFGLQLWLTFDDITGVTIADNSGHNRNSYRGSNTNQRFPCHKKREPFQVASSTGVLGGPQLLNSIGASSRIEIKLPGIPGIGNKNESFVPMFRFNKKFGSGSFYHAACGYVGNLAAGMLAQSNSMVEKTGCLIYIPNQLSLVVDAIEYSISNVAFPTETESDPAYVEISYRMSFFRESHAIPLNYMVGLQTETMSVVKLILSKVDLKALQATVVMAPKYANVWIAVEGRCSDIPECQSPINTISWETSGSSFIDASSFSKFSDWKYVRPPFATRLYQSGPVICNTTKYFTPEPFLPSKVCKIGKYYLNNSIFYRPRQGDPLFLMSSKWNNVMLELVDFSRLPYGGSSVNDTLQGVIVECLVFEGSFEVPSDNCTCCYISNCFPPYNRVVAQSALPSTPAAVLRAVLSQNANKLESLLRITAPFDRSAINAAAALGNVDILRMLLDQGSALWDDDAIELASKLGSSAALDFLRSRTASLGYQGKRAGAKCLVRGDTIASFTGFVTQNPFFIASGASSASGNLGSLILRWSKPQLTDTPPNFPVSRLQNVTFWGLLSRNPKPHGSQLLKSLVFQGFQSEPIEINPISKTTEGSSHICVRTFVDEYPQKGSVYNVDDSFGSHNCINITSVTNEILCREFGEDVYFFKFESNQSTFSNNPLRPTVYPTRTLSPVFEPFIGVKIRKNQDILSQSPVGILNASSDSTTGPRFGKDSGREDLVLLGSFFWDKALQYGRIGSKYNISFDSVCGDLGHESVAFRFEKKVFPSEISFIAVIDQSSTIRISAKASPKRSQTRNFMQGDTPSSRLVYKRVLKNISAFEYEVQGTRFMKPESKSLLPWQYITGDTDGAWIILWEGKAGDLVVKDEPMKHRVTFCNDASFSWLETDTILVEVCSLRNLGTSFSDPGLQLEGVSNVQLNGTRGGSFRGLVQSLKSKLVYMPDMRAGKDSFNVSMKDLSNGLSSNSEKIEVTTVNRASLVAAGHIEAVAPFNYSLVVTLSGFTFSSPLDSFFIRTMPSYVILKQFDGTLLVSSSISNGSDKNSDKLKSQHLVTDSGNRIILEIPDFAAGLYYDSVEYSVGILGSNWINDSAKVIVHVFCRSATYYNTTLRRCAPCVAGTFSINMTLSGSCEACLPGTDSKPGSTTCTPCPIGSFAPRGSLCSKCLTGTYSPEPGLQMCIDCPQGTYSSEIGGKTCYECGNIAYSDTKRSTSCKSCPKLTISNSKTSKSAMECRCVEGSYEPRGLVGKECLPCPTGAYCHGNQYPPITRQHFWTSHSEWISIEEPEYFICDHRGVRNSCRGFPEFSRVELLARCAHRSIPGICDKFPYIPTSMFGNASAVDDRVCSRGYTGRICSSCSEGYYNYPGGTCAECPSSFFVLLISVVVITCIVLIAAASASPVIPIFISASNFQNLVLLSRFAIPHPPVMAEIWSVLSIFNTNFELIPFQCIMGSAFDWVAVWNLEVVTLFLVLVMCVGRWLVQYLMYRPLLNANVNRSLKQQRPTSANLPNRNASSYRPSRPSTPSSQRSDAGMVPIKNLASAANLVMVDVSDGAPSIDAGVFEDDSESINLDAKLTNAAIRNGDVRKSANIRDAAANSKMARTGLVSARSTASSAASSVDLEQWQGLSQDELDFFLDSAIWIGCFILEHFFYFGSLVTLRSFACRFWKSNMLVLQANPNIVCGDTLHSNLVGISTPLLLLNVALLPCGTLAVLGLGVKNQQLHNPKFMRRWGFIFERFEQEYYWWQMVVVFRKVLLSLIASFLFSDPYLQLAMSCLVLSVNTVLNLAIRPFRQEQHGTLDSLLMMLTIASYSLTLMGPTDMIELNDSVSKQESGILLGQLVLIGVFLAICLHYIAADLRQTEYELPLWYCSQSTIEYYLIFTLARILRMKNSVWDPTVQRTLKLYHSIQAMLFKESEAKRVFIAESNKVRLSRIQSAVRKDVERERSRKLSDNRESKQQVKLTDWNRHVTDADVDIRKWDTGDVLSAKVSWRTSKFDMRKRIYVLERLLREEAIYDSKSPKILNLEREITTALKITLQALKTENEAIYESLYDTEAECEALEQEKHAMELKLVTKERKINESTEKNAFLKVTMNLKAMGLSDESEWKEKLKEEESLRHQLEEALLQLQLKMTNFNTEL